MGEFFLMQKGDKKEPWDGLTPYYWEGEEFFETTGGWVEGFESGNGIIYANADKELDHLFLGARTGSATIHTMRTFVTNSAINFSGLGLLFIEWETFNTINAPDIMISLISVKTNNPHTTFVLRGGQKAPQALQTFSIDVSGSAGSYYIAVAVRAGNSEGTDLKCYKVWGEV